jgi:3-hydroxybutyryl-CoA dehydratase
VSDHSKGPQLKLADFPVGKRWTTHGVTLSDWHIYTWTGLTGDWHGIHINEVEAKQLPLGRRVVHMQMLFGMGCGLMAQTDAYERGVLAFLGVEKMRARGPAFPGDTIHVVAEVTQSRASDSKPDRGVVTLAYRVVNQDGKDVLTWDYVIQVHA